MKIFFKLSLVGCWLLLLCAPIAATQSSQASDETCNTCPSQPDIKKLRKLWFKLCLAKDDQQEAQRILAAGMDPNMLSGSWTPLHEAIQYNRLAMVEEALMYGADPDKPAGGVSPLDLAVKVLSPKIVKLLLAYGAHSEKRSNVLTPLKRAQISEEIECTGYKPDPVKVARIKKIVSLLQDPSSVKKVVRKG